MKKQAFNGFRLNRHETLPDFFTRVIAAQINLCIDLCQGFVENPDYAVHEIRKSTKRIRAVYQLFQSGLETETFENARRQYAGISDLLAYARRSEVYRQSLASLANDRRLKPIHKAAEKLTKEVTARHHSLTMKMIKDGRLPEQITVILNKEKQVLMNAKLSSADINVVWKGWKRTYRQGCNNLRSVMQNANATSMHNLRKRVKMIWNQLLLFQPVWPSVLNSYIVQFDRLAEKLGTDHDLAELEEFIKTEPHTISPDEAGKLLVVTAKKQLQIRQTAIPLATKLFAEKPGANTRRMAVYYNQSVFIDRQMTY